VCLSRGIDFSQSALSYFCCQQSIATSASELNQSTEETWAVIARITFEKYRAPKHGTPNNFPLPYIHTRIASVLDETDGDQTGRGDDTLRHATALSITKSPAYRSPNHRAAIHHATVQRHTESSHITVNRITGKWCNSAKLHAFLTTNCTKLCSKQINHKAVEVFWERGGQS
jgi:hypothetical protein